VLKIQSIITGCRTGRWLDCYCSEAAWSLWSPELSWRPLYFGSPVIGAAGLSKYMLFLSFSTPSALLSFSASSLKHECSCFTPIVIFPIPLILSMTVSPPSVFPCASLTIYWFIDVAIQCKQLYWLPTNKGRKTRVSELRTRSSHASLWSQIQMSQQHLQCPVAVFSLEQKVTISQMKAVSSVWMCCLASRSLSGLISQCSVYIDRHIKRQWS